MMSGGSGASGGIGAIREHYTPLPAGTVLWHVKPPAEFEVIDTIELDRPAGWALIDKALEGVGVERMGSSALVKGIVDELQSDEFDGG